MFALSDEFVHATIALHGAEGQAWIERLPSILGRCEQRWGISLATPFTYETCAYHYVAPAVCSDGTPVVVKVHAPTNEYIQEAEALRLYTGRGIARLLAFDHDDKVLLLERLLPGTPLSTLEDDVVATSHAATVMRQLWCPVPPNHSFPSVMDWGKGFVRLRQHYNGGHGPFPSALLEEAETLFAELSASMAAPVLLHGDLHHDNILAATRQPWLGIDPKGLVGEPAYEIGALLRNNIKTHDAPQLRRMLVRRVDQLAEELNLDRERIRGWGLSQAILSVWWGIEDSDQFTPETLAVAASLSTKHF